MARYRQLFLLIVIWLSAPLGFSAEVERLYETEVRVQDRGNEERAKGISLALRQILIKVSGDRDVPNRMGVRKAFKKPQQFVQQFRYRSQDQAEGDPFIRLWVSFDSTAVNRFLREAGVPIWGKARPVMLVWLAVEEPAVRYLLGADNNPKLSGLVLDEAQRRGIPVTLPLLDLQDRSIIDFTSVWGGFHDTAITASERYQAESILIGRFYQDTREGYGARWTLLQQDQVLNWTSSGYLPVEVIADGIDNAVDSVATRYAPKVALGEQRELLLHVDGVRDLKAYARVSDYLSSLTPVERSTIHQVKPDAVVYALKLRTDIPNLQQVIQLGNTLIKAQPMEISGNPVDEIAELFSRLTLKYRLQP